MSNKSASTNYVVTRGCLLNALVFMESTSGANAYRIIQSIRVSRVDAWLFLAPGASTAGVLDLEIEWFSSLANDVRVSSMGNSTRPAFITSHPPRSTLASFWSVTGSLETDVLFTLSGDNAGYNAQSTLVVDVHVDYTLVDPVTKNLTIFNFSGSAHQLAYNCLDNTSPTSGSGSGYLQPTGIDGVVTTQCYG
jgi:hypothetical protein